MSNLARYNTYAQTALASYATALVGVDENNTGRYRDRPVEMYEVHAIAIIVAATAE